MAARRLLTNVELTAGTGGGMICFPVRKSLHGLISCRIAATQTKNKLDSTYSDGKKCLLVSTQTEETLLE